MLNRVRSLGVLINLGYILFVMIYSGRMLYFKDSVRPQVLAASSSISNTEILPNKTEREVAELVNKKMIWRPHIITGIEVQAENTTLIY